MAQNFTIRPVSKDIPFFVFGDQVVFDYVLCSVLVLYNVYHVMVSCMGALCCN